MDDVPQEDPLPWLLGCARRVLANQRRGERRQGSLAERLARAPAAAPETPETGGGRPCSPAAAAPRRDDGRALKATVRVRVTAERSLRRVDVRYRAPAAVRDARLQYLTSLELPEAPGCRDADATSAAPGTVPSGGPGHPTTLFLPTTRNLAAGAPVHAYFLVPRACHGTARGRVALKRLEGPRAGPLDAVFAPGRDVARFSVKLP